MKKRNKKFNKHNHLTARPPMLVMRQIVNADLESKEMAAALAFFWGVAEKSHYDLLLDLTNLLMVAGTSDKKRAYAIEAADKAFIPVLKSIKSRYDKTGKLGVSGAEKHALVNLVEYSKQFWNRQPIELYEISVRELKAFYKSLITTNDGGFVNA